MSVDFVTELGRAVSDGLRRMHVVQALARGEVSRDALRQYATRYYGELRTFIDVKLPERLRLCPYDALEGKRFFAQAYLEEQGHFRPGEDHASLFARLCDALGIAAEAREASVREYAPRFDYLRVLEPSRPALVRELATAFAWESAAPALGGGLARALRHYYGVPDAGVVFFELHEAIDREHSAEALDVLLRYADTPQLQRMALAAVTATLELTAYLDDEASCA